MEIIIRHAEPNDFEAINRIYSQPKVVRGTLQLPHSPAERQRQRLLDPPEGTYSLVAWVDGELVGHLNLKTFPNSPRRKHMGIIGMGVHDEWQRKGVGTSLMKQAVNLADKWINLTRLELTVFVDNEPAIHLYQKLGFEIEGQLRNYAFRDGQLVDVYIMARIL